MHSIALCRIFVCANFLVKILTIEDNHVFYGYLLKHLLIVNNYRVTAAVSVFVASPHLVLIRCGTDSPKKPMSSVE